MPIQATEFPVFTPAMRIVTAITNALPASVTTSFDHGYSSGLIVRLIIPLGFGMIEANQLSGTITVTGVTTFTIDIDTTQFNVFAVPASNTQYAQVVPFGEINSTTYLATKNILPY